jgi:hypothetical protein
VEHGRLAAESLDFRKRRRGSEEAVVSKLRKLSPTTAGRLSRPFDISGAANSRRLNLFESSVKSGVEFVSFSSASATGFVWINRGLTRQQESRK